MDPVNSVTRGFKAYLLGIKWLKNHPIYILFLFIPIILGLVGVVGAGVLFVDYHADLVRFFLFEPGEGWWWVLLYYLAFVVFHLASLVVIFLFGMCVTNIIAAPIYEKVSEAIEKDLYPGQAVELSFWQSFRLVPEEIKKAILITLISLALFLVPGLNLFALFGSAFLVAWDLYDYPFARRGMRLSERVRHARQDGLAILGLSFWFLIPIVQIVLVPLAVVGTTILGLEKLNRDAGHK